MIQVGGLKIISRKEWGAKKPHHNHTFDKTKERIVIHHSESPTTKQFHGAITIQGIQRYHQEEREFNDIGYHLLVGPDLSIWEGRPFDSLGGHCEPQKGFKKKFFGNSDSFGICVIGNFDKEAVSSELKRLIEKVIFEFKNHFGMSTDCVFGHFQNSLPVPKTCPGKNLSEALGIGEVWRKAFGKK